MTIRDDRLCETWSDHVWDRAVLVASGRHPTRGSYQRLVATCARCKARTSETVWLDLPGQLPADDRSWEA